MLTLIYNRLITSCLWFSQSDNDEFAIVFISKTASFYGKHSQFSVQKETVFKRNTRSNTPPHFLKSDDKALPKGDIDYYDARFCDTILMSLYLTFEASCGGLARVVFFTRSS